MSVTTNFQDDVKGKAKVGDEDLSNHSSRYSIPKTVDTVLKRVDYYLRPEEAFRSTELHRGSSNEETHRYSGYNEMTEANGSLMGTTAVGHPGLKQLMAVPSTIHGMMKFLTPWGVAMVLSQTPVVFECRSEGKKQAVEPSENVRMQNDTSPTEHVLINPAYPEQLVTPVSQKRRVFCSEKSQVVTKEVAEWLKARIVRPVKYPTWISNPVLLKKANGSWRMCIDFKNINSACPKDYYPLPEIDRKQARLPLDRRGKKLFPRAQEDVLRPTGLNNPFAERNPICIPSGIARSSERSTASGKAGKAAPGALYQPIKQVLSKADTSGRLAPYSVELAAYNITYEPRSAIKGQILTDFINEVPVGNEAMVPQQTQYTIDHDKDRKEEWVLYTDGAASAKGSGAGLVLISPTKTEYTYALRLNFESTNNQADQINGSYESCKENMIRYLNKAKEYIGCFKIFKIQNIHRNKNQKVDVLRKLASVAFNHLTKEILVETLDVPSMDVKEINAVVEEEGETWMTPIINCLEKGIWPEDQNEARALRMKINQYVMEEWVLFKRSYLMPML
ncbi:hypothetical protein Tco_0127383 [Tanacetum coccineum]